jgi:hypothetical protein
MYSNTGQSDHRDKKRHAVYERIHDVFSFLFAYKSDDLEAKERHQRSSLKNMKMT